jgi:hypothetical protein
MRGKRWRKSGVEQSGGFGRAPCSRVFTLCVWGAVTRAGDEKEPAMTKRRSEPHQRPEKPVGYMCSIDNLTTQSYNDSPPHYI